MKSPLTLEEDQPAPLQSPLQLQPESTLHLQEDSNVPNSPLVKEDEPYQPVDAPRNMRDLGYIARGIGEAARVIFGTANWRSAKANLQAWGVDPVKQASLTMLNQVGQAMSKDQPYDYSQIAPEVQAALERTDQPVTDLRESLGIVALGKQMKESSSARRRSLAKETQDLLRRESIPGFWTETVPAFIAQVGAPLVGGMVAGAPGALTIGMAEAGGSSAFDALVSDPNISDDELNLTHDLNALIGTGSSVVAVRQLQRLGIFKRLAQNYKMALGQPNAITNFVKDRGLSILENASQETLEQIGSNYIASDVVGYDPARPLDDQLFQSAAAGGSAAVILDTILGAAKYAHFRTMRDDLGQTQWQKEDAERRAKERAKAGKPDFTTIEGDFTEVPWELIAKLNEIYARESGSKEPLISPLVQRVIPPEKPVGTPRSVDDGLGNLGPHWTPYPGAIPGEPMQYFNVVNDGIDTVAAALIEHPMENGDNSAWEAVLADDGKSLGIFDTPDDAARAVEFHFGLHKKELIPGVQEANSQAFWQVDGPDSDGLMSFGLVSKDLSSKDPNQKFLIHIQELKDKAPDGSKQFSVTYNLQEFLPTEKAGETTLYSPVEIVQAKDTLDAQQKALDYLRKVAPENPLIAQSETANKAAARVRMPAFTYGSKHGYYMPGAVHGRDSVATFLSSLGKNTLDALEIPYEIKPNDKGDMATWVDPNKPFFAKAAKKPVAILSQQYRQKQWKFYKGELAKMEAELAEMKKALKQPKKSKKYVRLQEQIRAKKQAGKKILKAAQLEAALIKEAGRFALGIVDILGGKDRIVIRLGDGIDKSKKLTTLETDGVYKDTQSGHGIHSIQVDINWEASDLTTAFRHGLETVYHELGHSLEKAFLHQAMERVRLENPEGYAKLVEDLRDMHVRWARRMSKEKITQLLGEMPTISLARIGFVADPNFASNVTVSADRALSYYLSADEFFAEMLATAAITGNFNLPGKLGKVVKETVADMQRAYSHFSMDAAHPSILNYANSFTDYLELLTVKGQMTRWLSKEADKVQSRLDAFKKMVSQVDDKGVPLPGATWDWESAKKWLEAKEDYNWFIRGTNNLIQIKDRNAHVAGLVNYVDQTMRGWHAIRVQRAGIADQVTREIKKLGRDQQNKLAKVIFDEDRRGIFYSDEALKNAGLDPETIAIKKEIKSILDQALQLAKDSTERLIREAYAGDQTELRLQLAKLDKEFADMAARPYFPHMRYGNWTVGVYDDKGKVIHLVATETRLGQKIELQRAKAQFSGNKYRVFSSKLSDEMRLLQGMPAYFMQELAKKLPNLTKEQQDVIKHMIEENSPVKGYKARWLARRGVEGYSEDLIRGLNSFVMSWASHTARSEYAPLAKMDIDRVREDAAIKRYAGDMLWKQALATGDPEVIAKARWDGATNSGDVTKLERIIEHMERHLKYMTEPQNEWQALRSFVFFTTLGFNIKSAAVNFSSIPMVTYPYLAARYGHEETANALNWAVGQMNLMTGNPNKVDPRVARLVEWGIQQGFVDQSLMTDAAVASSEYSQHKNPLLPPVKRWAYGLTFASAVPFQVVEKTNRYLTSIAAAKLAWDAGNSDYDAMHFARVAVDHTQNENARWNNPEWLRGKKAAFFPFMKYVFNTLNRFAFGNDPAALRWWLVMAAGTGLTGLPFADDLMDLLDATITYGKGQLGYKNPHTEVSADLHNLVGTMGADPELVLHGLARDSFGASYWAETGGLPIPRFDLSGSLGMGNILPGTKTLKAAMQGQEMSGAEFAGKLFEEAGATSSNLISAVGGLVGDDPDTWRQAEVGLPTFLRNASKAFRASANKGIFSKSGDTIAEFDTDDPVKKAELYGLTFSFQPTAISEGMEVEQWKRRAVSYYQIRYRELLKAYDHAVYTKDREAIKRAYQAIETYKRQVPFSELAISGEAMRKSVKAYALSREYAKRNLPTDLKQYRLERSFEGLQDANPQPEP